MYSLCNNRCIPPQLLALIKELPGRVERELLGAEDADYGFVARHHTAATTDTETTDADAASDAGSEGSSSSGDEYDADDSSSSSAEHPADRTARHCAYTHFLTWLLLLKHIHRYTLLHVYCLL
jgi:hypothetical protein